MTYRSEKYKYLFLTFICLWSLNSLGQSFLELQKYVDEADLLAVDKAITKIQEADKLMQVANIYFNEAIELQSNDKLNEKTLKTKITKAKDKALSMQIQADKMYSIAYQTLYEICQRNLQTLDTIKSGDYDGYVKTAENMINNAYANRKEASGINNPYEKATLLNDAAGMENAAIENMIFVFKAQSGVTTILNRSDQVSEEDFKYQLEVPYTHKIVQVSENLAIDQSTVKKYEDYVTNESIPNPIMVTREGVVGLSEVTIDQARTLLLENPTGNIYANYGDYGIAQPELSETNSKISSETKEFTESDLRGVSYKDDNRELISAIEKSNQSREAFDISTITQYTGIRFMVQLAASRIPLTRSQVWAIYPGNATIEIVYEDSWYKYRLTGFRLFSEADRVADESGVEDVWVLAKYNGNSISVTEARERTRVMEADVNRQGRQIIENEIDYYIQIMVSQVRLSEGEMKSLHGYSDKCREIIEEGWFKYQVYAGTDYKMALSLRNEIDGEAFIVAYKAGSKRNIIQAPIQKK